MSVNSVSSGFCICSCGSVDFEQIQIEYRLRALGIEPSGDKNADRNKLHEIELMQAKRQNEPSGKFLTISYSQEQEMIKNKKERLYPDKNIKREKDNKEILKEDEILGKQILAIIEMKKREEKDYKKSKELRANGVNKAAKNKQENREIYSQRLTNFQEIEPGEKNLSIKKEIKN